MLTYSITELDGELFRSPHKITEGRFPPNYKESHGSPLSTRQSIALILTGTESHLFLNLFFTRMSHQKPFVYVLTPPATSNRNETGVPPPAVSRTFKNLDLFFSRELGGQRKFGRKKKYHMCCCVGQRFYPPALHRRPGVSQGASGRLPFAQSGLGSPSDGRTDVS